MLLDKLTPPTSLRGRYWPTDPSALSRRLRVLAVTLEEVGVVVRFVPGHRYGRRIEIRAA